MADRVHDLQFHEPPDQQAQRPAGAPLRRRPAAQREELRLALAVELAQIVAFRILAFERTLQSVLHAHASHALHTRDARVRGGGDLRIAAPALGPIGVGQQQDARVPLPHRTGSAFAQDGLMFVALLRAQSDVMLFLWHRSHLYTKIVSTS